MQHAQWKGKGDMDAVNNCLVCRSLAALELS